MYVSPNFPTKKALKDALAKGDTVTVFQPGLGEPTENGVATVEGPHYPQPHRWYGRVLVEDGKVTRVLQ